MTWSISHGGTRLSHGYSYVANLAGKLEKAAPKEWPALAPFLRRPSGEPFELEPFEAEQADMALHRAADKLKFWDRSWAATARQMGDSALLAARLGEPWRWS